MKCTLIGYRFHEAENRLDILINNAAVMIDRTLTVDGHEMQFATNHLGPFLLTNLLLDTLKASAPSRIVTVSSDLYRLGMIDRDDLMGEKAYTVFKAYSNSKLANILFTRELAKRLEGTNVTANVLHPGVVSSELRRNATGLFAAVVPVMKLLFFKTPKSGAQTTIWCALDPALDNVSGEYFCDNKVMKLARKARDDETAEWLWQTSVELTGLAK